MRDGDSVAQAFDAGRVSREHQKSLLGLRGSIQQPLNQSTQLAQYDIPWVVRKAQHRLPRQPLLTHPTPLSARRLDPTR